MKATRNWTCFRCDKKIVAGDEFWIIDGEFLCDKCKQKPIKEIPKKKGIEHFFVYRENHESN